MTLLVCGCLCLGMVSFIGNRIFYGMEIAVLREGRFDCVYELLSES